MTADGPEIRVVEYMLDQLAPSVEARLEHGLGIYIQVSYYMQRDRTDR